MKKFVAIVLCLAFMLNLNVIHSFANDEDIVVKWQKKGVIKGDENGDFNGEQSITRAELIVLINRIFGIENENALSYDDVKNGLWYYDDVVAAINRGYLTDGGLLLADANMSYAEAVDMIVRATGIAAPVGKKELAIAEKKVDTKFAYSIAIMEKHGFLKSTDLSENIIRRDALDILDKVYTSIFEPEKKAIDFSDSQRKYVDDNFEWDLIDGFPKNWYSENDDKVSVINEDENNYVLVNNTNAVGEASVTRYFPPMTGVLSMGFSVMTKEITGEKFGPYLYTDRDRTTPAIKFYMLNGYFYASDGVQGIRVAQFNANTWYNVRLDIDLSEGIYDVYIDGVLVSNALQIATSITVGNLAKIKFGLAEGKIGTLGFDNISVYSSARTQEAIETPVVDRSGFSMDFQSYEENTVPNDWTYIKKGSNVYIEKSTETPNKYLVMNKPGYQAATDYDRITYTFSKPLTGIFQIEWRAKVDSVSTDYRYYTFGNHKIQVIFLVDKIQVYDSSRTFKSVYSGVQANKWYNMKIIGDTSSNTYSLYVNGQLAASDITFVSGGEIPNMWMQMAGDSKGKMYIDDIKTTVLGTKEVVPPESFDPDSEVDTPELSDWIKENQQTPTGYVVEAEDMELVNFKVIDSEVANGGKAISVTSIGNASAKYVFDKPSGYYKINVGYIENNEKVDSSYRIYHNGKQIDFWYGKFDDGLLHIRDVKNKYYVENGDVFVLEGYNGRDPSTFDYIEFTEPIDIDFKTGYLVRDQFHSPGYYARSSWEYGEEGGAARMLVTSRRLDLMDNNTAANVWARRRIFEQPNAIEARLRFQFIEAADNISMEFRNDDTPILKMVTVADNLYAVDKGGNMTPIISAYTTNKVYNMNVRVDTNEGKALISLSDGSTKAVSINTGDSVNNFFAQTGISQKGHLQFNGVEIYAGYIINDDFRQYDAGAIPFDWEVTDGVKAITTTNYSRTDLSSLLIPAGGSAVKRFDETKGMLTAEFDFLMENEGSFNAKIGGVSITAEGGDLYLNSDKSYKLWEKLKKNLYYNVLLEFDTDTKLLTVYINHHKKAETDFIDNYDSIAFSANGTNVIIDEVIVYNGIDKSNVPEPQKVDTGDYIIGMQTCDLWTEGEHFGWDHLRPYDSRTPILGYFSDLEQETMDWQIKWWAEHGISLYFPCWYREFRSSPIRESMHGNALNNFMKSKYSDNVKFAICYENSGGVNSGEDFKEFVVNYWIEHYIKHPSYMIIDNKPVIGIWNFNNMTTQLGGAEGSAKVLAEVEQMLIDEGYAGAIFITYVSDAGADNAQKAKDAGYDYAYVYGFGASGGDVVTQVNRFDEQRKTGIIDRIASVSQGWGAEPWGQSPRKTNVSLADFRRALEWSKNVFMPSYPKNSLSSKLMLLGNWNEIAEGHIYMPLKLQGFGYLDQIMEVFADGDVDGHVDIIPEQKYDVLYPALR